MKVWAKPVNTVRMTRFWRFHREWALAAPPDSVYAVCADIDSYPSWWREVRAVERIDEDCRVALIRSVLPYSLRLTMARELEDPVERRLRVRLGGDLTGWAEFRIAPGAAGNRASTVGYHQEVEVTAPALRRVAPLLGPALRANHAVMMRSCERGLSRRLR